MSNLSCRNVILQDSLNLWLLLNALTSTHHTFSIVSSSAQYGVKPVHICPFT